MAKKNLLLVDADSKSLRMLEVSLRKSGFSVTTAISAADARDKVKLSQPDLIITDTKLPGDENGFELVANLKAAPETQNVPIIFLSSENKLEQKVTGLELGVEDYLTKPIYIREVLTRVRVLLEKREKVQLERRERSATFAGSLGEMGLVDLMQTVEIGRKTGRLFIETRGQKGSISFREGKVADAHCARLSGERAFYRMLVWNEGVFSMEFGAHDEPDVIELSTQGLLMEGMRRVDEWGRLLEQLPPLDRVFEIDYGELVERLAEIPDEINGILRLFDGRRTLLDVVDESDFGDLEALEIASKLYFEGLIFDVTDRPADEPAPQQVAKIEAWLGGPEDGDDDEEIDDTAVLEGARLEPTQPPGFVDAVSAPPAELSTLPSLSTDNGSQVQVPVPAPPPMQHITQVPMTSIAPGMSGVPVPPAMPSTGMPGASRNPSTPPRLAELTPEGDIVRPPHEDVAAPTTLSSVPSSANASMPPASLPSIPPPRTISEISRVPGFLTATMQPQQNAPPPRPPPQSSAPRPLPSLDPEVLQPRAVIQRAAVGATAWSSLPKSASNGEDGWEDIVAPSADDIDDLGLSDEQGKRGPRVEGGAPRAPSEDLAAQISAALPPELASEATSSFDDEPISADRLMKDPAAQTPTPSARGRSEVLPDVTPPSRPLDLRDLPRTATPMVSSPMATALGLGLGEQGMSDVAGVGDGLAPTMSNAPVTMPDSPAVRASTSAPPTVINPVQAGTPLGPDVFTAVPATLSGASTSSDVAANASDASDAANTIDELPSNVVALPGRRSSSLPAASVAPGTDVDAHAPDAAENAFFSKPETTPVDRLRPPRPPPATDVRDASDIAALAAANDSAANASGASADASADSVSPAATQRAHEKARELGDRIHTVRTAVDIDPAPSRFSPPMMAAAALTIVGGVLLGVFIAGSFKGDDAVDGGIAASAVDAGSNAVALLDDAGARTVDAGATVALIVDAGTKAPRVVDAGTKVVIAPREKPDAGTNVASLVDAGTKIVVAPREKPDAGPAVVVSNNDDPEAQYVSRLKAADAASKRGEFAKSVREYKAALVMKPNSFAAHVGLGNAYYELDTNDAALTHLEKARALSPREAQVYVLLGAVYQTLGRKDDAVTAYRKYLELAPEGKFARDVKGILKGLGIN